MQDDEGTRSVFRERARQEAAAKAALKRGSSLVDRPLRVSDEVISKLFDVEDDDSDNVTIDPAEREKYREKLPPSAYEEFPDDPSER